MKRTLKIGLFIISVIILILSNFYNIANVNPDLMSSLPNLVITLYTALIAVSFSIFGFHLTRQYGLSSIDILTKKSKQILIIYTMVILFSIISIIFNFKDFKGATIEITTISINVASIMIGILIISIICSIVSLYYYILDVFRISPVEVMRALGYPNEIVKIVREGKLQQAGTKLSRGLSIIRGCIMDLSLRDDLENVVSIFSNTIEQIPWEEEKMKNKGEGNDISTLVLNVHVRMDECIFDPLMKTDLKPDTMLFSRLFCNFTKMYIDSDLLASSLFYEYLDKLCRVAKDYVSIGKKEALNDFLFSVLWVFNGKISKITDVSISIVLSKGIALSASLIKMLETKVDKLDDIKYIFFVLSSYVRDWLYKHPRAFIGLEVDDLIDLMEKGGIPFIGNIVIVIFRIENELEKIKETEHEFVYNRTNIRFEKIKSKIKEILKTNRWQIFVENNSLNVLDISDRTIGAIQLTNILNQNDVNALKSFIQRNLT